MGRRGVWLSSLCTMRRVSDKPSCCNLATQQTTSVSFEIISRIKQWLCSPCGGTTSSCNVDVKLKHDMYQSSYPYRRSSESSFRQLVPALQRASEHSPSSDIVAHNVNEMATDTGQIYGRLVKECEGKRWSW